MIILLIALFNAFLIAAVSAYYGWRSYRRVLYITQRGYTNTTSWGTWYAPDLPNYGVHMMTLSEAYKRERAGLTGEALRRADGPGTWLDE